MIFLFVNHGLTAFCSPKEVIGRRRFPAKIAPAPSFPWMKKTSIIFLKFFLICIGFAGLLYACGLFFRPALPSEAVRLSGSEIEEIEALRDTAFDPDNPPTTQREVDFSEGASAAWYPKGESPILAELVEEGALPPVAERVGPEPLVLEGIDGTGRYGGTWLRVSASSPDIMGVMSTRLSYTTPVRWSPMGYPIRPHVFKSWEVSEDYREWTFHLRKGMRWSDGHPFSADDILFWWRHQQLDPEVQGLVSEWMTVRGEPGEITKIDAHTLRFSFPHPYPLFLEQLAMPHAGMMFVPKHYMEQFHPALGNQELIAESLRSGTAVTARGIYWAALNAANVECPRLWPWLYRTSKANPPQAFVRNPYYFAVDPEGNQLPYVDRILFEVKNPKFIPVSAAAGAITMQSRNIEYADYTLLMENREKNDYQIRHWFNTAGSPWTIWPNQNRRVLPAQPESAQKSVILKDKRFRQALSLAINRQEIIDAVWHGRGEPSQNAPSEFSPFFHPELKYSYTAYDPEEASRLLDEIGLTQRDGEGMRTFPDGSRMSWYIDYNDFTGEGPIQFVVDDWAAVGIRAIQRERPRSIFDMQRIGLTQDFMVWTGESDYDPIIQPKNFVAATPSSYFAPGNGAWFSAGGFFGTDRSEGVGVVPEEGSAIRRGMEIYLDAISQIDREAQIARMKEALDIAAEEVHSISITSPPPIIAVVKDGFKGVPENVMDGYFYGTPGNAAPETFYFENPEDSPGAIAQIKYEMVHVTPPATGLNPKTLEVNRPTTLLSRVIGFLIGGSILAAICLLGFKHPYIGHRLLIMVPTLAIISVITFFIIQLPPGNYIETRILQLEMSGDLGAIQEVEELREAFHLDEPVWKQYLRWSGLKWFTSFKEADRGLLQGELGRSMAVNRSVNDVVGDRVLLTFLVSLATVLFTWVVALPIGIYSAVRQYSLGDYILTFIGFIGMCIPNFLLALVLMFLSSRYLGINVTGLFSPEYAAMPEWSWGKFVDLLKHIWVPVVVIATAGTAGMIRVMRGNLLDELSKPYVTTAMAKGVRPFKLLMKYPVRVALNPFISGIGGIFPQLVSGGAIVAIVLSLPMVGPVLLEGLMQEDVYLAGSMLMVLSLLGVFGTLVSDLLLLWLDPRIRMEGGSK